MIRFCIVATIYVVGMLFAAGAARATWKPEYAAASQEVQDWYKNAELTEAAQQRFFFKKCCDHADVVKTKFRVGEAGHDVWEWLDPETNAWREVPADIIHGEERAPGGQPVLFVVGGKPVCFFLPEGGI